MNCCEQFQALETTAEIAHLEHFCSRKQVNMCKPVSLKQESAEPSTVAQAKFITPGIQKVYIP